MSGQRIKDEIKKAIIADRACGDSIREISKKYNVSTASVQRIIKESTELAQLVTQKKEQNTADILAYMENKRLEVCAIIGIGLSVLPDKIRKARTASEVTTAIGTLIDKFTANGRGIGDTREKDALSKSLEEMAKRLESDG